MEMQEADTAALNMTTTASSSTAAADEPEANQSEDGAQRRDPAPTAKATETQSITSPQKGRQPRQPHEVVLNMVHEILRSVTVDAELQCILCHDIMFKSGLNDRFVGFSRVCLLDSFLSRSIDEAQCSICRAKILEHLTTGSTLEFSVNVTMWNLIQILMPPESPELHQQLLQNEETEYTERLDKLQAKWSIRSLQENTERFHEVEARRRRRRRGQGYEEPEGSESEESDLSMAGADWNDGLSSERSVSASIFDGTDYDERTIIRSRQQQSQYPIVKTEQTVDGRLQINRSIVLDSEDANEDGYLGMRVALAIIEFPSIVELFNDYQECSLAVVKMEEDEERSEGFPFFMDESGDDDAFIIPNYYNEIVMTVLDDGGNIVLQRTRAAQQGTVSFPALRLDVPGGVYTFRFVDSLYGIFLSIKTELREPHETTDAPLTEEHMESFIADEAHERGRNRRGRRQRRNESDDDDDEDTNGSDSNDSFIVNDDEVIGQFSGAEDEDDEGEWEFASDDEERDERLARRQQARRARRRRRHERAEQEEDENIKNRVEYDNENDDEEDEAEHNEESEDDEEEEAEHHEVRSRRRMNAAHILDSDNEDEDEDREERNADNLQNGDEETNETQLDQASDTDRNESDSDEDNEGEQHQRSTAKIQREDWEEDSRSNNQTGAGQALSSNEEEEIRPRKRARRVDYVLLDEESDGDNDEQENENANAYQEDEEEMYDRDNEDEEAQVYDYGDGDFDGDKEDDDVNDQEPDRRDWNVDSGSEEDEVEYLGVTNDDEDGYSE